MKFYLKQRKLANINFLQKGTNPTLLLMSGTHGDEYEVIEPLKKIINKYSEKLPDFIFIPEVSPTAVKLKTRRNESGHDTNRKFFDGTDDVEAKTVMNIVTKFNFRLGVSFHEDWEYDSFYLYDSEKMDSKMLNNFKTHIKEKNIGLYSGVDDSRDVTLGSIVHDGYITIPPESEKIIQGDFWDWALVNGFVKRLLYPEIPSNLPLQNKIFLIDLIFQDLIFPLLNKN